MHNGGIVIPNTTVIYFILKSFPKSRPIPKKYVIPKYTYILISIRSRLLMPEAYGMTDFMYDDSNLGTHIRTQVDYLNSSVPPQSGIKPKGHIGEENKVKVPWKKA